MSATISLPTDRPWLATLLRGHPHQIVTSPGRRPDRPYLRRWFLVPHNRLCNIYLHQFCDSDDDTALHDHPWSFLSLILNGSYREISQTGTHIRRAGSIAIRRASGRHRVQLIDASPVWTLVITGPKARQWGFWCRATESGHSYERFVPWDQFGPGGCAEPQHATNGRQHP